MRALSRAAFSEYSGEAEARAAEMLKADTRLLVCERDGRPVGFAALGFGPQSTARLDAIAVVEEWRGRGVGRALLSAAEQRARDAGALRLRLATADSNLAALDLFLKHGYRIVRTEQRYYPRGQNAHVLERDLEGKR